MNELHKPLGTDSREKKPLPWTRILVGTAGVLLLSLAIYIFVDRNARPGPAVVAIGQGTEEAAPAPAGQTSGQDGGVKPLSPLEPIDTPGSAGQNVEQPAFKPQATQTNRRAKWLPDPDLIEDSEFGPLPKVSDTGLRPLDAYSQSSGTVGANRVAIIVGGLGLSQTGTQQAIDALPSSVTLAFSPSGNSLNRWAQTARKDGHEIILQLPMEPLGYPSVDPGPRTLVTNADPGKNTHNLRWALGRMTNYPVVMNYLGANFSNSQAALAPVLEELHARGVGYLDDGSVQASVAPQLTKELRIPNAKGNIVIDAVRDPVRINAALDTLEQMARASGFAIGSATAFPESVDAVAKWVEGAAKRGIVVVPVSNLVKDYPR